MILLNNIFKRGFMVLTAVLHQDALHRHLELIGKNAYMTQETISWRDSMRKLLTSKKNFHIKEKLTDGSCLIDDSTGKVTSVPSYMIKEII